MLKQRRRQSNIYKIHCQIVEVMGQQSKVESQLFMFLWPLFLTFTGFVGQTLQFFTKSSIAAAAAVHTYVCTIHNLTCTTFMILSASVFAALI